MNLYLWLAKQRPHNKRMNRILLLNAKKKGALLLDIARSR